jgi:hypothetical protein
MAACGVGFPLPSTGGTGGITSALRSHRHEISEGSTMGMPTELSPLVGRWSTTITMLYPAEQKGQRFEAEDTYRWLPGENILIHDVTGEMNGEPVRSIEIYWNDGTGHVRSRSFDSGGEVSDFSASMRNGEWKIDGESQRFASTTVTEDTIEGLWQLRIEDRWEDWMTVSLKRKG